MIQSVSYDLHAFVGYSRSRPKVGLNHHEKYDWRRRRICLHQSCSIDMYISIQPWEAELGRGTALLGHNMCSESQTLRHVVGVDDEEAVRDVRNQSLKKNPTE